MPLTAIPDASVVTINGRVKSGYCNTDSSQSLSFRFSNAVCCFSPVDRYVFFREAHERFRYIRKSLNKSSVISCESKEFSSAFYILGSWKLSNVDKFFIVGSYPFLADDVFQVDYFWS